LSNLGNHKEPTMPDDTDDTSFADFLEMDLPKRAPSKPHPVYADPGELFPTDHTPVGPIPGMHDITAEAHAKAAARMAHLVAPAVEAIHQSIEFPSMAAIAAESTANAAVQGIGSLAAGQLRAVGFSTADGYITAIRNGVPERTHAEYIVQLRTRFGLTSAALDSLKLPGPFVPAPAPVDTNPTVHVPTGPSVFERPRPIVLGPAAEEALARTADQKREHDAKIRAGRDVVAGAVAEGHGVILGWQGGGSVPRKVLCDALAAADVGAAPPKAKSARAHAGRALELATREGLVVRVQRGGAVNTATWSIGLADHQGSVGDKFGTTVMRAHLSATDVFSVDGDHTLAPKIRADFDARVAAELFLPSDLTAWLADRLEGRFDAVRLGLGFYVPARHAKQAESLCRAVAGCGFGRDWILPAIPLATSDELREGIARGLQVEVSDLLDSLASEREAARVARTEAIEKAMTLTDWREAHAKAIKLLGDIGEKRAGTFLHDLREIGKRVVAYGEILGTGHTAGIKGRIQLAIQELESLLGDDYTGISERFAAVWDEINMERRGEGGIL
jgi:hypothetical protein